MHTKLVTLSPLGSYFFGGENGFGQGVNQNYFVSSLHFPQQTSLLGMLRFELLKSDGESFDASKGEVIPGGNAAKLIGTAGFDANHDTEFGIINCLSPVFLISPDGIPFHYAPPVIPDNAQGAGLLKRTLTGHKLEANNLLTGNVFKEGALLSDNTGAVYDGKRPFKDLLRSGHHGDLPMFFESGVTENGVFIAETTAGNRKNYDGGTDESGFYKQNRYSLVEGWRFAVLLSLNDSLPAEFGTSRLVQLGAEKSTFLLEISDLPDLYSVVPAGDNFFDDFGTLFGYQKDADPKGEQLILLSDAWLPGPMSIHPYFEVSSTVSFRHLTTHLNDPNQLWSGNSEPKSIRYNLYKRGSVFWSTQADTIANEFHSVRSFRRIGYNYCITI